MSKKIKIINKSINTFKTVIGIMTGTSFDGVDVLITKIKGYNLNTKIKIIDFKVFNFPINLKQKIKSIISKNIANLDEICYLNYEISKLYKNCIYKICKSNNLLIDNIDFVGISGQTFYHIPKIATLQLGNGTYLSGLIQKPVVWDMRASDIAADGQGAPLMPYLDYVIFSNKFNNTNIITLNIGGISNLTFIPENKNFNKIIAFDCGPGNMIIDKLAQIISNNKLLYDKNAKLAKNGNSSNLLFHFLKSHPYLKKLPPKSTGRETFGDNYVNEILNFINKHKINLLDTIRTLTEFTAYCIINAIEKFILKNENFNLKIKSLLICSGGGIKNPLIMSILKSKLLEYNIKVITSNDVGVDYKLKEALLMAVIANETIYGNPSNVPSATGANKNTICGSIAIG